MISKARPWRVLVLALLLPVALATCGSSTQIAAPDSGAAGSDAAAEKVILSGSAGTGGGGGAGGSPPVNCATVGCSAPPMCALGCQATCGCCSCGEGDRQDNLVCHGGCWAPTDAGAGATFTSFRLSAAYGPCPPGGDCAGYIEIDADGTISRDFVNRPDAGAGGATLTAAELTDAVAVFTAPALISLLDATQTPCIFPTDVFEEMKLVDSARTHANSTTTCANAPIKAARDKAQALADKYLPQTTH